MGSSNYITNIAGYVSQHMEYFAFGETFVEEHKNSINSPFKFNGKELDEESGLYYYGARYYDPKLSIWASVDPLANFNPFMDDEHYIDGDHNGGLTNSFNHASYSYCYQNPIKLIDPNGKQVDSRSLFYAEFSTSITNFFGEIDNFFYESKQSVNLFVRKASIKLGLINAETKVSVNLVHKEKSKPNLKAFLKASLYNQQVSDKSKKQELPSLVNTTSEDYTETSVEGKATVTSAYGQTTLSVKTETTDKDENSKTKTTMVHGIKENGLYIMKDSEGNTEVGFKTKITKGRVTTEEKIGYEKKGR